MEGGEDMTIEEMIKAGATPEEAEKARALYTLLHPMFESEEQWPG
jgi:hypothetical protein